MCGHVVLGHAAAHGNLVGQETALEKVVTRQRIGVLEQRPHLSQHRRHGESLLFRPVRTQPAVAVAALVW